MNGLTVEFSTFQSHAGSIEAMDSGSNPSLGLEFQSHAGSIEAALDPEGLL